MRQEIRAGAESLRLREFSLYFFEVGLRLAQAIKDEQLFHTLRHAISGERYRTLTMRSLFSGAEDDTEYCQQLTSFEQRLYRSGQASTLDMYRWTTRSCHTLKPMIAGVHASSK